MLCICGYGVCQLDLKDLLLWLGFLVTYASSFCQVVSILSKQVVHGHSHLLFVNRLLLYYFSALYRSIYKVPAAG